MCSGIGEDPSSLILKEHEHGQKMLLKSGMVKRNSEKGEEKPQSKDIRFRTNQLWVQMGPTLAD